jgi:hypothetical protein
MLLGDLWVISLQEANRAGATYMQYIQFLCPKTNKNHARIDGWTYYTTGGCFVHNSNSCYYSPKD